MKRLLNCLRIHGDTTISNEEYTELLQAKLSLELTNEAIVFKNTTIDKQRAILVVRNNEIAELKGQLGRVDRVPAHILENIANLKAKVKTLEADIVKKDHSLKFTSATMNILSDQLTAMTDLAEEKQAIINKKEKELNEPCSNLNYKTAEELKKAKDTIRDLSAKLDCTREELVNLKDRQSRLITTINTYANDEEYQKDMLGDMTNHMQSLIDNLNSKQCEIYNNEEPTNDD